MRVFFDVCVLDLGKQSNISRAMFLDFTKFRFSQLLQSRVNIFFNFFASSS